MASSDAKPFPIKNTAYRVYFPILDADGDLVTGATGLDSEASLDGATFADCTNEATEVATSSGIYYLDLTTTEMNTDCTVIIVKTSSSGAKTTVLTLYPVDTGDIDVDVTAFGGTAGTFSSGRAEVNATHWGGTAVASAVVSANAIQISGDATAADNAESFFDGTGYAGTNNTIPTVTTVTNVTTVNGLASGVITAASIAADAIGASELAADAVAEIADAVWDEVLSGHLTGGSAGYIIGTNLDATVGTRATQASVNTIDDFLDTEIATIVTQTTAASIRTAIGMATGNLDTQLGTLATATALATLDDFVDTEVATIVSQTTASSIRSAVGLASANLDTQLSTIDTVVDSILDDTGTAGVIVASLAANSVTASALATDAAAEIATAVLTTQMTESYRATNAAPTLAQAQFELIAHMGESAISSTTKTLKKIDGSTTAKTYTLDSATTPTAITETT